MAQSETRKRIRIPPKPTLAIRGKPIGDIVSAYETDDSETRAFVEARLNAADRWSRKTDAWYLERTARHTPVGMWTVACPFHPERVRDFSADNFEWGIEDPWKLVCRLCREEGREHDFYPNPRYPDGGRGCYPTDEVWREGHDEAWSRAHSGIPHDHWDGKPHGYSASGYCYHFTGKCSQEIMTYMATVVLPDLAIGFVLSRELDLREEQTIRQYSRKVKLGLLCLTRAHLGDEYLARVLGLERVEFDDRMAAFHAEDSQGLERTRFPGYRPYDLFDGVTGDPEHPPTRAVDLYGGGSFRGDAYAQGWLQAYALVRDSFCEEEEPVRQMIERLLLSGEGDAEALGDSSEVKPGKLELAVEPYAMSAGRSDNLGGRELANQFDLGVALNDEDIVDAVVQNVWLYLRNYFNSEGLGRETSPSYTLCAWNSMRQIFERIYGFRGHYDATHPWWDEDLQGLNPYRDPVLKHNVAKFVFCRFPDGTTVPWMDAHATVAGMPEPYLDLIANEGGGLPEAYRPFYTQRTADTRTVLAPHVEALPSMVLHESGKVVLRSGNGADRALLSLNYSLNTGHWHPAPMDLVLYAQGHELASDLGYFGAMHWLTQDWIKTCEAHNTCLIRDEAGCHDFMHEAQGQLRTVYSGREPVGVVELCEQNPDVLAEIPGGNPFYQRTCALVSIDDEPSRATPYAVDIFRVRGGHWHDYMLHCQGQRCEVEGIALADLDPEESLYEVSGFHPAQDQPHGSGRIRQLRTGETDASYSITWRNVLDIREDPPRVDAEAGMKLTMLGAPGTQVYLGQAPGERKMSNVDQGEILHVLCARRRDSEHVDPFVSILEPFRGQPCLKGVTALPVEAHGRDAVALRVDMEERTDYLISLAAEGESADPARITLEGGDVLETDGTFTFVSCRNGVPSLMRLCGGTRAAVSGLEACQDREFQGALVDFDDEQKTLTVRSDRPLLPGNALEDEVVIIEHERGTTSFTIDRIAPDGDREFVIHLKWSPHLFENRLRVVSLVDRELRVEPPPSMSMSYGRLQYQIYRIDPDDGASHVAQIEQARIATIGLDRAPENLSVGDLIGLTRMSRDCDRFRIPGSVTVMKGQAQPAG